MMMMIMVIIIIIIIIIIIMADSFKHVQMYSQKVFLIIFLTPHMHIFKTISYYYIPLLERNL